MQDVLGEPVDPSWLEPLWTDERMGRECAFAAAEYQEANNRFDLGGVKYSYEIVAKRMRDEYERDRSNFQAVYEQYISKPDSDADRARLVARVAELEAQRRDERRMFEDLTPGGSEFHDSPRAVAAYLKDRMSTVIRMAQRAKAAEARVALLEAELAAALDAAITLGEHVEMWSDAACDRDNARRARYRELTGRGWDEEDAANE